MFLDSASPAYLYDDEQCYIYSQAHKYRQREAEEEALETFIFGNQSVRRRRKRRRRRSCLREPDHDDPERFLQPDLLSRGHLDDLDVLERMHAWSES
jgi:hypothetical protein